MHKVGIISTTQCPGSMDGYILNIPSYIGVFANVAKRLKYGLRETDFWHLGSAKPCMKDFTDNRVDAITAPI